MIETLLAFEAIELSYMVSVFLLVICLHLLVRRFYKGKGNALVIIGGAEFTLGMLVLFLSVFLIYDLAPFIAILTFIAGATMLALGSLNMTGGLDQRLGRFIVGPAMAFGFFMMGYFLLLSPYQDLKLIQNGEPAMAEIVKISPTGNLINEQPEVRLFLVVRPENGPEYETTKRMVISPVYLPQFQPGAQLKIKYDPNNIKRIAVEAVKIERR
ncbi:MAG: hypothetical protein JW782_03385 [Candidatus Saganbacteria bacterium]|nr:hypothetical protein [Candidatus Saganbacteria bacterium]